MTVRAPLSIADKLLARSTAGLTVTLDMSAEDARALGILIRRAQRLVAAAAGVEDAVRRRERWAGAIGFTWGCALGVLIGANVMAALL